MAEIHCAKVHCQDSVLVFGLVTYRSLSTKNNAKNAREGNDDIIGDISG